MMRGSTYPAEHNVAEQGLKITSSSLFHWEANTTGEGRRLLLEWFLFGLTRICGFSIAFTLDIMATLTVLAWCLSTCRTHTSLTFSSKCVCLPRFDSYSDMIRTGSFSLHIMEAKVQEYQRVNATANESIVPHIRALLDGTLRSRGDARS